MTPTRSRVSTTRKRVDKSQSRFQPTTSVWVSDTAVKVLRCSARTSERQSSDSRQVTKVEERNDYGLAPDFSRRRYFQSDAASRLNNALEEPDASAFLQSLMELARSYGVAETARQAGLNRTALYRTLSQGADPRFSTLVSLLSAMGLRIVVQHVPKNGPSEAPKER
jgi:probable addiction module antidote protein